MNRGSLYHYIESKDDLLWAIVDDGFRTLEERVLPLLGSDAPAPSGSRPRSRPTWRSRRSGRRAHAAADGAPGALARAARRDHPAPDVRAAFRRAIRDGVAAGDLRPGRRAEASIAVLSLCNWFTQWYRPDGPMTPEIAACSPASTSTACGCGHDRAPGLGHGPRRRHDGRSDRLPAGGRRRARAPARPRPTPRGRPGAGHGAAPVAGLPGLRRRADRHRRLRGAGRRRAGLGLGHRGHRRAARSQARAPRPARGGPRRPAGRGLAARLHQHQRDPHRLPGRGPLGGLPDRLPRHPLLQPAALRAPARADPARLDRPWRIAGSRTTARACSARARSSPRTVRRSSRTASASTGS